MATGMTFDIQNPTGTVLAPSYAVGTFGEDAKAMTDRLHDYNAATLGVSLPSYLVGKEYIMIANNNRDNAAFAIDVTIAQHSLVYLLIDNRLGDNDNTTPPNFSTYMKWVAEDLWLPVSLNGNQVGNPAFADVVGLDEGADGSVNQYSSVYLKIFPAGTFTLNEFGEAGRNMYGVVVAGIPEPSPVALALLGGGALLMLSRRRRTG
ncbi:MAG: PEP-CTERM sorting domain-containing protein [Verrucomicrobiales bacterium]|nr:PEP-CTERM sorting domain-containing protein [Verrucomicrobiales bacterium]